MRVAGCGLRGAWCEVRGAWCVVRGEGLRISTISAFLAQSFRVRRAHCKAVELHTTNTLAGCIKCYTQNHEY